MPLDNGGSSDLNLSPGGSGSTPAAPTLRSGADIGEAAPSAGLSTTTTSSTGTDWVVTRLTSGRR